MNYREAPRYPKPPLRPQPMDPNLPRNEENEIEILKYKIECLDIDINELNEKNFISRWFNREKLFQLEDKKENLEFELRCFTDPDLIEAFKEIDKL